MKGVVFVHFIDHLENTYGIEKVDTVIQELKGSLSTNAAYTTVGNYPHGELLALAQHICSLTGTTLAPLIRDFADYLLTQFHQMHPSYFEQSTGLFDFMSKLEILIHADIRKLYPDAQPPTVLTEQQDDGCLLVNYQSHRPLAQMAVALTEACAARFSESIEIEELERSPDQKKLAMRLRKQS